MCWDVVVINSDANDDDDDSGTTNNYRISGPDFALIEGLLLFVSGAGRNHRLKLGKGKFSLSIRKNMPAAGFAVLRQLHSFAREAVRPQFTTMVDYG